RLDARREYPLLPCYPSKRFQWSRATGVSRGFRRDRFADLAVPRRDRAQRPRPICLRLLLMPGQPDVSLALAAGVIDQCEGQGVCSGRARAGRRQCRVYVAEGVAGVGGEDHAQEQRSQMYDDCTLVPVGANLENEIPMFYPQAYATRRYRIAIRRRGARVVL